MANSKLTTLAQAATLTTFLLALLLPALQMRFQVFEEERLHGVEAAAPSKVPAFSWRDIANEKLQRQFDSWFQEQLGFRGYLVRTDNQLNLSLFSEMSSTYGSPLVLGKEDNLFERLYIDDFNGRNHIPLAKVELIARRLAQARKALAERGIPLLVLLSPSKATVYQDEIPRRYLAKRDARSERNYDQLVAALKAAEVPYFDGLEFVLALKEASPYHIFPKGGTHWSQHTSCLVVSKLTAMLQTSIGRALHEVVCDPPQFKEIPEPFDRDLADLSNIWNVSRFSSPLPYPPDQASNRTEVRYQPKLIFVGGSFLWTIFESFERNSIYRERTMLYYFKRIFRFPGSRSEPTSAKHFNWKRQLEGVDAVIIEINEANIHQAGSGSIGDIIHDLRATRRRS